LFGKQLDFLAARQWLGSPVAKGLIENGGFSASDLRAIDRENALELFPRLKHDGDLSIKKTLVRAGWCARGMIYLGRAAIWHGTVR